jgi:hypothetical protein
MQTRRTSDVGRKLGRIVTEGGLSVLKANLNEVLGGTVLLVLVTLCDRKKAVNSECIYATNEGSGEHTAATRRADERRAATVAIEKSMLSRE